MLNLGGRAGATSFAVRLLGFHVCLTSISDSATLRLSREQIVASTACFHLPHRAMALELPCYRDSTIYGPE